MAEARKRPELTSLNTTYQARSQQLRIAVDRDKARLLGLDMDDITSTLQTQFGSSIVSQFNQYSRVWYVIMQSEPEFRASPTISPNSIPVTHRVKWFRFLLS